MNLKRRFNLLLSIVFLLTLLPLWATPPQVAQAGEVSGTITSSTTWTLQDSPYTIVSELTIAAGVTLTIEPGVVVQFADDTGMTVDGTLIARGTAAEPIRFTSNRLGNAEPGNWRSINFTASSQSGSVAPDESYVGGSIIEHAIVEYGGQFPYNALNALDSAPYLTHVIFSNNANRTINIVNQNNAGLHIVIRDCSVSNNDGFGISIEQTSDGTTTLRNNTVVNNGNSAMSVVSSRQVTIADNTVNQNNGGGIWVRGEPVIEQVTISGNTVSGNRGHAGSDYTGIHLERNILDATISDNLVTFNTANRYGGMTVLGTGSRTVTNNVVTDNTSNGNGGGITLGGGSTFTISNNTIRNNRATQSGGGLFVDRGPGLIVDNIIAENSAGTDGGGIWRGCTDVRCLGSTTGLLDGNVVTGNTAGNRGGGMYVYGSQKDITNNTITGNTVGRNAASTVEGAGLYVSGSVSAPIRIEGNEISGNRTVGISQAGGGIAIADNVQPTIRNNTIANNSADSATIEGAALYNGNITGRPDVDATGNWWGSTDQVQVEQMIWHEPDDGQRGLVVFDPLLSGPIDSNPEPVTPDPPVQPDGTLQVFGISPNQAIANSGYLPIVIEGENFGSLVTAQIGLTQLLHVTQATSNTLYAVVPVGSLSVGTHDLSVTSGTQTVSLPGAFEVLEPEGATQVRAMVVFGCDNNLEEGCNQAFNELEAAMMLNPDLQLVALWDGPEDGDSAYYLIQPDGNPLVWADYTEGVNRFGQGELNTGDAATLVEFASFTQAHYPGRYTFLSLVGHGGGWAADLHPAQPRGSPKPGTEDTGGILWDDQAGSTLTTQAMAEALQWITRGQPLDVLYFDACLMGSIEVAAESAPYAEYLVAHENITWAIHPYVAYLGGVSSSTTPEELAQRIVDMSVAAWPTDGHPNQIAAINSSTLGQLLTAVDALAVASLTELETLDAAEADLLRQTFWETRQQARKVDQNNNLLIDNNDTLIDLHSYADLLAATAGLTPSITTAAQQIVTAIDDVVIANEIRSGRPWLGSEDWQLDDLRGLSIYFPAEEDNWLRGFYNATTLPTFAGSTQWDEFIQAMFGDMAPPPVPTEPCLDPETCLAGIRPDGLNDLLVDPPDLFFNVAPGEPAPPAQQIMLRVENPDLGEPLPSDWTLVSNVPWITLSPESGTFAGSDETVVSVSVDASGLSEGYYEAQLIALSDTSRNVTGPVNVVLEVGEPDGGIWHGNEQRNDLWITPFFPRVGQQAQVGALVHHPGGKNVLADVPVRFFLNGLDEANRLGDSVVPFLDPPPNPGEFGNTVPLTVTLTEAGTHTLYGIVDPDNTLGDLFIGELVISRTVVVQPPSATDDAISPIITNLRVNNGNPEATSNDVPIELRASDPDDAGPASGVRGMKLIEYLYRDEIERWVPVQRSEWISYTEGITLTTQWTLAAGDGMRYIHARATDAVGNISIGPVPLVLVNYQQPSTAIAQGEVHVYRYEVAAGQQITARLESLSGDADLYVWSNNAAESGRVSNLSDAPDVVVVPASQVSPGVYQVEVYGYTSAEYRLTVTVDAALASRSTLQQDEGGTDDSKAQRGASLLPVSSVPDARLDILSFTEIEALIEGETEAVYLPLIVR